LGLETGLLPGFDSATVISNTMPVVHGIAWQKLQKMADLDQARRRDPDVNGNSWQIGVNQKKIVECY